MPCPRAAPACQTPMLQLSFPLPRYWGTNICSQHQRINQMAFKLTAVWEVINQEHQDHDFMCKVMGSGREGCAEGCLQCYRSCSLSETTDMWEGNAWERWGDLNRVVWESHLASAIIFKGTSGGFLHFERRPSLHSPCSGRGGGHFLDGHNQSLQPSWGRGCSLG